MNSNMIFHQLKRDLKVFLVVTLALAFFYAVTMLLYTAMKDSILGVTDLYSNISPAIQDALNFKDGQWNHVLGFYSTYFVYYIPLMGGAYSIYLGVSILSREEQDKTAEFLLSKPVGRAEVLSSRIAVMKTYIFLMNLVIWVNGVIWTGFIGGFEDTFSQVTILHIYGLFICMFFGFLGLLISVIMKRARAIIGTAVGIVMGLYMLDMILRITDKVPFLLYLTPFKYMNINLLDTDYQLEIWRLAVLTGSVLLMAGLSFLFYRRKDILV